MFTKLGIDPSLTHTTAKHVLGTRHLDNINSKEYVYVKATEAISAGDFVQITLGNADAPYAVEQSDAATKQPVACAPVAIASGSYGWVQVKGKVASANVLTDVAAGRPIRGSATAGRADDYAAADAIYPVAIVLVTAASNLADVQMTSQY